MADPPVRISAGRSRALGNAALRIGAFDTWGLGAGNVLQRWTLQLRIRAVLQRLRTLHLALRYIHALQTLRLETLPQGIALRLRQFAELALDITQPLLLPLGHIVELTETLLNLFALIGTQLLEVILLLARLIALFRCHLLPACRSSTQSLLLLRAQ